LYFQKRQVNIPQDRNLRHLTIDFPNSGGFSHD
jgi:hypothetical protein